MSSKLRLNGKGTRGSAALSEKEQIDLAIALSLQQQGKEPQQRSEQLVPGGGRPGDGQPDKHVVAAPAATNAVDVQLADEPRKRRAAGHRKKYVLEESDSEGSQATSSGGPDDYKPEASGSESDQDDDSDFAGDDESEDEGPRKKRKSEAPKGKKPPAKAPAGRKKAGLGDKAVLQAAAATRGTKPLPSAASGAAGARGRKSDATVVIAASGRAPAAPVARHLVSKPTATARPAPAAAAGRVAAVKEDSWHGCEDASAVVDREAAPPDADIGNLGRQQQPDGAGCVSDLPSCLRTDVVTATAAMVTATAAETVQPKAAELKVKAAVAPKVAATKVPPLGKPATVKGPAQAAAATPKLPPKPLVLTNRTAPSAAMASAPFKPPIGTSGGATGIKAVTPLSAGAMPYRVPGLRRPGGSSAAKKPS